MPTTIRAMDNRLNKLQRVGRFFDVALSRIAHSSRAFVAGSWTLLGSKQIFNVLVGLLLVVLVYIGQQAFIAQRHLSAIAEAQQVSGYAVMRQMQAMGWTNQPAPAATATSAPQTIAPELLEANSGNGSGNGQSHTVSAAKSSQPPGK
jgi:hypothetical protein